MSSKKAPDTIEKIQPAKTRITDNKIMKAMQKGIDKVTVANENEMKRRAVKGSDIFAETMRQQKLQAVKGLVQEKKIMEYTSDTIELYDMISDLFDYEVLRKESDRFHVKQYKDSIYRGEIKVNRKRDGKGVIVYDSGRIYEGDWENDKRNGRGFELFPNGNKYLGQFADGKAHGKGSYTWRNGEQYEGEWVGGQKHGYVVWHGIQGDSFIGNWVNNKADGYGLHTWMDGDRYEGEWKDMVRHGKGTDFFANGDVYTGEYAAGKPEGFGQYKWSNGNSFTGQFVGGMKHGKGKWKKEDTGSRCDSRARSPQPTNQYDGYYERDKKHGYGEFTWESGNRYCGNYHEDERQGYGKMTWTDGSTYTGHWETGVQHGIGTMTFPDGAKRAGFFERNMFKDPLTDASQLHESAIGPMPAYIKSELLQYLTARAFKAQQLKIQGVVDVDQILNAVDDGLNGQHAHEVEEKAESFY